MAGRDGGKGAEGQSARPRPVVPIARPYFGEEERRAILGPLEAGWPMEGPKVAAFEAAFSRVVGCAHARAVSSGTAALHAALAALDLRPGGRVAIPAFTHVATAHAAVHVGLRPLFVDCDPATFNLDPHDLRRRVAALPEGSVVALLPVHLFGLAAPMDEVADVAAALGVPVVEDAACGLGATFRGRSLGTLGELGCFSFHPRKVITTGEGGMVTTNDPDLAARVTSLRNFGAAGSAPQPSSPPLPAGAPGPPGAAPPLLPDVVRLGHNLRMTDLQAAIGEVQLARLPELLAERARQAARYTEFLHDEEWLALPTAFPGAVHAWQSYVVRVRPARPGDRSALEEAGQRRDALLRFLAGGGVQARPGSHAVHILSYYAALEETPRPWDLPGTMECFLTSLALPLFPGLGDADQDRVVELLREFGGRGASAAGRRRSPRPGVRAGG